MNEYESLAKERARLVAEQNAHEETVRRKDRRIENLVLSGALLSLLSLIGFLLWMMVTA